MDVLYLCNGKRCSNCSMYFGCYLTTDIEFAKNGKIKGLINLIKRFKIHFRPKLYLEEKR